MRSVAFTQGAMRLFRQTFEGFGLVGAWALGREGFRRGRYNQSPHRGLGPGEVHDDEEPHEGQQNESVVKKR